MNYIVISLVALCIVASINSISFKFFLDLQTVVRERERERSEHYSSFIHHIIICCCVIVVLLTVRCSTAVFNIFIIIFPPEDDK